MRVYLGPYQHWFRPASWLRRWILYCHGFDYSKEWDEIKGKKQDALSELDALEDSIRKKWYYKALRSLERFVDNRTNRKMQVRIDYYDTWNADHTLAVIALPLMQALKEKKMGSPRVDDDDVPQHLRRPVSDQPPDDFSCDEDVNWHPRWAWVLDEIIWALSQVVDESADDVFFSDLYAGGFDRNGLENWQARKQHGLMLFGKYLEALWD